MVKISSELNVFFLSFGLYEMGSVQFFFILIMELSMALIELFERDNIRFSFDFANLSNSCPNGPRFLNQKRFAKKFYFCPLFGYGIVPSLPDAFVTRFATVSIRPILAM